MLRVKRTCALVAVLQLKGGPGKTTLATNLAAAAHLAGYRTVLLDLDKGQRSSTNWAGLRVERIADGWTSKLEGLRVECIEQPLRTDHFVAAVAGCDVAILDGPPRLGDVTRAAATAADVAVIPCAPGQWDVWACRDTWLSLDESDARRASEGLPPIRRIVVLNRAQPVLASAAAEKELRATYGRAFVGKIRHRVAFFEAADLGESVHAVSGAVAAVDDIERLWRTIRKGFNANLAQARST